MFLLSTASIRFSIAETQPPNCQNPHLTRKSPWRLIDEIEATVTSLKLLLPPLRQLRPLVLPQVSRRRKPTQPVTITEEGPMGFYIDIKPPPAQDSSISITDIAVEHPCTAILGEDIGEDDNNKIIVYVPPHPRQGKLASAHTKSSPPDAKMLPSPVSPTSITALLWPESVPKDVIVPLSSPSSAPALALKNLSLSFLSSSSKPMHRVQWSLSLARQKAEPNMMFEFLDHVITLSLRSPTRHRPTLTPCLFAIAATRTLILILVYIRVFQSDCWTVHQGYDVEEPDQEQELNEDLNLTMDLDIDSDDRIIAWMGAQPRKESQAQASKRRDKKVCKAARQAATSINLGTVIGHNQRFVKDLMGAATLSLPLMVWHARKSVHEPAFTLGLKCKSRGKGAACFSKLVRRTLSGVG
ncbi:hypothetical protein EDB87DRAFT_1689294 [Lactarius vividus]|nr:hypothetical protein EDB87DRAFT_1689294 [Lactarius vividus]